MSGDGAWTHTGPAVSTVNPKPLRPARGTQERSRLGAALVIAVDIADDKLQLALDVGADHAIAANTQAAQVIAKLSRGFGANAVFDFVGSQETVTLAGSVAATYADIVIVGVGHGALPMGYRRIAFDANVRNTFWGSRSELWEVVDLARSGRLNVHVETYSLDQGPQVYERLARGEILGRAVIVPHSR